MHESARERATTYPDVDPECGRIGRVQLSGFTVSEFWLGGGYRSRRHAHELAGLVLPVSGTLTLAGSFGVHTIQPGQMLTLPAGATHSEHTAGAAGCLLLEPAAGLQPCPFDGVRVVAVPAVAEATRRLSTSLFCTSAADWEPGYEAVELLALASDTADLPARGRTITAPWVRRTAERLREEYTRPPSLAELARDAGVSREHLAREFRRTVGVTVGDFVRRQQILAAVHLLLNSGLSISQVALAAGFTDESHLCRRVRCSLGTTPGRIRSGGEIRIRS
jgi:AraC family transcriptional regulator